jgi:hypothetical protein
MHDGHTKISQGHAAIGEGLISPESAHKAAQRLSMLAVESAACTESLGTAHADAEVVTSTALESRAENEPPSLNRRRHRLPRHLRMKGHHRSKTKDACFSCAEGEAEEAVPALQAVEASEQEQTSMPPPRGSVRAGDVRPSDVLELDVGHDPHSGIVQGLAHWRAACPVRTASRALCSRLQWAA